MKIVRVALEKEWARLAQLDTTQGNLDDRESPLLENATRQAIVGLLANKLPGIENNPDTLPLIGQTVGSLAAGAITCHRVRAIELRSLHQALIHHTINHDEARAEKLDSSAAYLKDLQTRLQNIDYLMAEARNSTYKSHEPVIRDDGFRTDNQDLSTSAKRVLDPVGTLSHRVRTPLQAAKLRMELLIIDYSGADKESEELEGVLRSLDEAIRILNKYTLPRNSVSHS